MKLSSILLTAFLSTVQATPIAAPTHDISATAVDIGDRSVLVKRLHYDEINWTPACVSDLQTLKHLKIFFTDTKKWACMWAQYGTLGAQATRAFGRIPRSLYQTSLLYVPSDYSCCHKRLRTLQIRWDLRSDGSLWADDYCIRCRRGGADLCGVWMDCIYSQREFTALVH